MTTSRNTQLLYDGRKAVPVDLLGDVGWSAIGGDVPVTDDVRVLYARVGLLYRCTQIRADSLSKVPWVIANAAGDTVWKKGDEPPPDLRFLKQLSRLLKQTEAALTLGSQAYWHKERNRVMTKGLRWLAPVATQPYWHPELGLTHFIHNTGVRVETYAPQEIVYLWHRHPLHETVRDVAPAEAAMAAAGVLYNVDAFVSGFFERGAVKVTLLTVQGNPPPAERERLKSWWDRLISGTRNAFKSAVVSADAVTPVVIGEGISELSNTELTGEKRNDVAITLGVPLSIVFSDAANYATASQDEKNFYNSTIIPECELIAEQVDEQLLDAYGYHLIFKPETMDVFQVDEHERSQSFSSYVGAGLPMSLTAEMLGIDLPDGWEYEDLDAIEADKQAKEEEAARAQMEALNAAPVAGSASAAQEDVPRKAEIRRFKAWAKKRKDAQPADFKSSILSQADKAALLDETGGGADQPFFTLTLPSGAITHDVYKALVLQLDPDDEEAERTERMGIEVEAREDISKVLTAQQRIALDKLRQFESSPDWMRFDTEAMLAEIRDDIRLSDMLQRALSTSASLGVEVAILQFANIGLAFDWTLAHEAARSWANAYTYDLVGGINGTTERLLRQAVTAWIDNGLPLNDLVAQMVPIFGEGRALRIASTEVTRAYALGTVEAYRASGVVQELVWRTVVDERVCPYCGSLHNKVVDIEGQFSDRLPATLRDRIEAFALPPAHPNCRCFVAARIV